MSNPQQGVWLLCLGDVYPGEAAVRIDRRIRSEAAGADVVIANLESPIAEQGEMISGKSVHLRSTPASIATLKDLSLRVACLANNHITDWGPIALAQTRRLLHDSGIQTVGAGANRDEAEAPAIVDTKGMKIGVLAFGWPTIQAMAAGPDSPGVAALEYPRVLELVSAVRPRVDALVVALHWGYTNYHYPLPEHVQFGRSLIERGAALVVGHHPHVMQGFENYRHGAILYSLGNFMFADFKRGGMTVSLSRENHTSAMAVIQLVGKGVGAVRLVHAIQQGGDIRALDGCSARRRERFIARLSHPLAGRRYARFFRRYTLRRAVWRALLWLNPRRWKSLHRDHLRDIPLVLKHLFAGNSKGGPRSP